MRPQKTCAVFIGHLLAVDERVIPHRADGTTFELIAARGGFIQVAVEGDAIGTRGQAALIPPRSALRVVDGSGPSARLYVEAASFDGRALRLELGSRHNALTVNDVGRRLVDVRCWDAVDRGDYITAAARMLGTLETRRPKSRALDSAVVKVISRLNGNQAKEPTSAELSDCAGISLPLLRGRFFQAIGMTMGTYARWQRLRRLAPLLQTGSIADAAVQAGFRSRDQLLNDVWRLFGFGESDLKQALWIAP